ncbi:hypothetical protein A5624_19925 [Mycobacterium sp. 1482292.6]|uniref:SMODS domain-containing nucleotidyltransferase n=1 Tax=Mycobacterium sp. 1482292.6 TaxID=1834081 RepID=UPI000800313E|nr:nucleotidyltransferase [Mycobacterium sp. 1482292.6]OBJ08635.1 hypothetical protein A5624_19925 [Mycobacterium sp. 1482292.6]
MGGLVSTYSLFSSFHSRISLKEESQQQGLYRVIQCGEALRRRYFPDSENVSDHITLLGSLVKDTGIEPLLDADVLFRMPAGTYSRFDNYAGNGQSALLQEVRDALQTRYPRTVIRGDGPVVVVSFSEPPAIEVVPAVLLSEGSNIVSARGFVPVTREGGRWEHEDYGAEWTTLNSLDKSVNGQLRRLICYMKVWRRHTGALMKSIVLEMMATAFMSGWDRSQTSYTYDDWLVRDFLKYMVDHYTTTYYTPGTGKAIDTGVGWYVDATNSAEAAANACLHLADDLLYRYYWREVFGSEFGI